MIVIPTLRDVVDEEIAAAETSVNRGTTLNNVLTLDVKNGYRPFLAFCGQAWPTGFDTFITWRVRSDGNVIYRLRDSSVQLAAPQEIERELTPWIELPRSSRLRFEVDVTNAATVADGLVTARFRVYYVPIETYLENRRL